MKGRITTKYFDPENILHGLERIDAQNISSKPGLITYKEVIEHRIKVSGRLKYEIVSSESLLKRNIPDLHINRFEAAIIQESSHIVLDYISSHLNLEKIRKILFTSSHSLLSKKLFNNVRTLINSHNVRAIVDFKKVNYTRFINKYFESINSLLPDDGFYIGCVESNRQRNKRLYTNKNKIVSRVRIVSEYIIHRILPKLDVLGKFYFAITRGKYRFLSAGETLGRLVSCGFEIIEFKEIHNLTFFVVKKVREPYYEKNKSDGLFIKGLKEGKDGRYRPAYKFRLQHSYTEYLQVQVLRLNASVESGAVIEDIRLNKLGRFVEKLKLFPWFEMADIFYIKHSLGKGGKPINIYKFRTMKKGADKEDYLIKQFNSHGNPVNDPRITRAGRFLRKVWIDELPQLYNVLRGDIKLVGIRPMRECDWERYPVDIKEKALNQRPGIMGVQYGFVCKDDLVEQYKILREYLNQWERFHLLTDLYFFFRIWYNIFFKGVRSE